MHLACEAIRVGMSANTHCTHLRSQDVQFLATLLCIFFFTLHLKYYALAVTRLKIKYTVSSCHSTANVYVLHVHLCLCAKKLARVSLFAPNAYLCAVLYIPDCNGTNTMGVSGTLLEIVTLLVVCILAEIVNSEAS